MGEHYQLYRGTGNILFLEDGVQLKSSTISFLENNSIIYPVINMNIEFLLPLYLAITIKIVFVSVIQNPTKATHSNPLS